MITVRPEEQNKDLVGVIRQLDQIREGTPISEIDERDLPSPKQQKKSKNQLKDDQKVIMKDYKKRSFINTMRIQSEETSKKIDYLTSRRKQREF